MRPLSKVAPDWWDYTTLDREILDDAARLTAEDLLGLSRPGFKVVFYDTLEDFYLAEALEYITAWRQATPDAPAGICGPIGPTEQLPLVARLVNELEIDLRHAHFWGMDEWVIDGVEAPVEHPLSFRRADMELCFNRIRPDLRMPEANLHFPAADLSAYKESWNHARCLVMQGGQGEVKHWAFNDPPRRAGAYKDAPPSPEEFRKLETRIVELHPMTLDPERPHLRRRRGAERAQPGAQRRSGRNVESREGLDLAGGQPRQPVRHAPDDADDRQAPARRGGPHVAAGRSPERAVQFLPARDRVDVGGDALKIHRGDAESAEFCLIFSASSASPR